MASNHASVLILTHGAGSNRDAPLLVALDRAFSAAAVRVERVNLYFRERRPKGPPYRHEAVSDRARLVELCQAARADRAARVYLGGHSYGGRQSTLAVAEHDGLADALLLLSYPLHPPRKAEELRTAHFPKLRTPALFVHGTRDPFGSIAELEQAIAAIPARTELTVVEGAGHDLAGRSASKADGLAEAVAQKFLAFAASATGSPV